MSTRGRYYLVALVGILAAAALVLLFAAKASAQTTILAPAGTPFQAWVDEAKMPTPDTTITVVEVEGPQGCPGAPFDYAACTIPSDRMIWLGGEVTGNYFERPTFLHELGHNVDVDMLAEWMRTRFMAIMDLSGEWIVRVEGQPKSPRSPDEIFANVYAQCAVKPYIRPGFHVGEGTVFGADPEGGAKRHNQACRLIERLRRR
jgi:hypothetical protein